MKFLSEYEVSQRCITFRSHIHEAIYVIYTFVSGGRQPPSSGRCWPCTTYIPTHPTGGVSYTQATPYIAICLVAGNAFWVVISTMLYFPSKKSDWHPVCQSQNQQC
jgi:hypothetical protein